jgi:predicted metalloprotease with PDZ domain
MNRLHALRRAGGAALSAAVVAGLLLASAPGVRAQGVAPLTVAVDATSAPLGIYHVDVTMPAAPGAFTFVYPKWIPGYHGPTGPVEDVVSLNVSAGGATLPWRRDLVDFYAFHTTVPAGVTSIRVTFDVVRAPSRTGQIAPVGDANIAVLEYSTFAMYPQGAVAMETPVDASLKLPDGWNFGTALPVKSRSGSSVAFARTNLYTLIDSPIESGIYYRAIPLGGNHELDVAADSEGALNIDPSVLTGMRHLVAEGPALYGVEHYRDYHFLLSLSDAIPGEGIEHHESSDNRDVEDYLSDADKFRKHGTDLMSHEYSHSWNGKYRRPADLFVANYQDPERTDLLWVYEGLNEYLGQVLSTRARLNSFDDELENLGDTAAYLDYERGREWRPLQDTADAAPMGYMSPRAYGLLRRNAGDFYAEGDLVWLEADVTIRKLTHGARSLDDFCKLWAAGGSTTPSVKTYVAADVYALLNQVVPYDWAGFFAHRIGQIQPHAPLGGITGGGYELIYDGTQSDLQSASEGDSKSANFRYSLGFSISTVSGTVFDVVPQSPADKAGIAPGMTIVAVDGRKFSADLLHKIVKASTTAKGPIEFIVSNSDFFKTVDVQWTGGERYPHLKRVAAEPDLLQAIYAPKTFKPAK